MEIVLFLILSDTVAAPTPKPKILNKAWLSCWTAFFISSVSSMIVTGILFNSVDDGAKVEITFSKKIWKMRF